MKFFVTGVGGQLGHDVMNELLKRGHEGVGSDIQENYSGVADDSAVTKAPYIALDITDKDAAEKVITEVRTSYHRLRGIPRRSGLCLLTEGSMKPVACLEDEPNQCSRAGECVTLRLWKMLDEAIEGVLDKVTLQDLKDWYEEMGNDYVI